MIEKKGKTSLDFFNNLSENLKTKTKKSKQNEKQKEEI